MSNQVFKMGKVLIIGEELELENFEVEEVESPDRIENHEADAAVFTEIPEELDSESLMPLILYKEDLKDGEAQKALKLGFNRYVETKEELEEAVENLTELYRGYREGKISERRLEVALEYIPYSVYFKDDEKRHTDVSRHFIEDMGSRIQSKEDVVGKTDADLHSPELADETMSYEDNILEEGYTVEDRLEYSKRDQTYNLTTKAPIYDENGNIIGIFGITRDITEKKRWREMVDSLHDTTDDLLRCENEHEVCRTIVRSVEGSLELENAGFFRSFSSDLKLAEATEGFEQVLSRNGIFETVKKSFDSGEKIKEYSEELGFYVSSVPLGNHGVLTVLSEEEIDQFREEVLGILCSNAETALDRIEQQRRNRKLAQFADIISHDLRNPLNIAQGYLNLAEDSEEVEEVENALSRMEDIIEDLLQLAKKGDFIEEIEKISLEDVAGEAWRNVETANASLKVEGDLEFRADRGRMKQVLENLFRNAVEHGGRDVTVKVGVTQNGFYVEDDGCGVSDEELEKIFDYNFSTSTENTGIGLSIVKKIVQAHGWSIRAEEGDSGGLKVLVDF